MKPKFILAAATALLGAAAAAAPGPQVIPVPGFRSVELNGGGKVVIRHGAQQRVTLVRGDTERTRIEVRGPDGRRGSSRNPDRLVIDACRRSCNGRYDLQIEIVTPRLEGVAIRGGGTITAASGFPTQPSLGAAIDGGGIIDIRSMPARDVGAAISGGGRILTTAERTLGAAVNGGGDIRYWGNPKVGTAINGGGAVGPGR